MKVRQGKKNPNNVKITMSREQAQALSDLLFYTERGAYTGRLIDLLRVSIPGITSCPHNKRRLDGSKTIPMGARPMISFDTCVVDK